MASDFGPTWQGGIIWYDASDAELGRFPALFSSTTIRNEKLYRGVIPSGAASCVVRFGFDAPNIEPGEWVLVSGLTLEVVDPSAPYAHPGEFLSEIYRGGTTLSAQYSVPGRTSVRFEIEAAAEVDGLPGEFKVVYPPTASSTAMPPEGEARSESRSFAIEEPYFRYRVQLVPDGESTPTLRSVSVGGVAHDGCTSRADVRAPRVRLIGAHAAPTTEESAPLAFSLEDGLVNVGSVRVLIDGEESTSRFKRAADVDGRVVFEEIGDAHYAPGLHTATISASDFYGNAVDARRSFYIGEQASGTSVTLREDGTTLIDGKPFFPVGIYGVMEREFNGFDIDEAFRGLKEAGFNFAHSYAMPHEERFIKAAEKYGFKLWTVARIPDEKFLAERLSPAIIAWYLGDDTSYNTTPEELDDYFFSVKAVDPTRITVQADPIASGNEVTNYRPYVAGTDAFLPEIYPVRKDGAEAGYSCVAETIRDITRSRSDAVEAQDGPKAIWAIIQYFQGWGWRRFPTYPELRAMSFGAVAAGANGITWYTYGGTVEPEKKKFNYGVTTSPERWRNISALATQINELSEVLLEPTEAEAQPTCEILSGPSENTLGGPTVVRLLKRHAGKTLLVAVNAVPEEVSARFILPEGVDVPTTLETLYDERETATPTTDGGAITERFEPFGVRIWRW